MIFHLLFVAIVAVACAAPATDYDELQVYDYKKIGIHLDDITGSNKTIEDLLDAIKKFGQDGDVTGIFNFELNPITDDCLNNLRSTIIRGGMDPLELEDQTLKLGLGIAGSIKLTNGWLQDLSTIVREDDIVVSYNSANKKVTFSLPLKFKDLMFTYKYVTRAGLLIIKGDALGKIDNVKLNTVITYDGNTQAFTLDSLRMTDSGKVTVKFTGNGLVDWLTNSMTSVITTILHPLIMIIVQSSVKSMGEEAIDVLNAYMK